MPDKKAPPPKKQSKTVVKISSQKKKASKSKKPVIQYRERVLSELYRHTYPNNDKALLIEDYESFAVLAKNDVCNVTITNTNSIFQPYEKKEEKSFCSLFVLKWENGTNEFLECLKKLGCPVYDVINISSIKHHILKITSDTASA